MIGLENFQIELSQDFQSFIAEVPELPGCIADGLTEKEALQNLQPIINEWIATANARNQNIKLS